MRLDTTVLIRLFSGLLFLMACSFVEGCASTPKPDASASSKPIPRAYSDDPLDVDNVANMAADDVEALRLKPGRQEPSRRPRDVGQRRAVTQPRVRP